MLRAAVALALASLAGRFAASAALPFDPLLVVTFNDNPAAPSPGWDGDSGARDERP